MNRFTGAVLKAVPIAAVIAVLIGSGAALRAQNLVQNGGFEAGNAGWSFAVNDCAGTPGDPANGADAYIGAAGHGLTGDAAHSGLRMMYFGALSCKPSVFQSLATVVGQTYDLNFWVQLSPALYTLDDLYEIPNFFQVALDNSILQSGQLTNDYWVDRSYSFIGTGSDVLTFSGNNPDGYTELDDVSVVAVTPEPATLLLLGTGFFGVGLAGLRRRKA